MLSVEKRLDFKIEMDIIVKTITTFT